jgi:hypothetical protein
MQMTHLDTQFVATLPAALLPFASLCTILFGMVVKFLNELKRLLNKVDLTTEFSVRVKIGYPRPAKLGTNQ